MQYLIVKFGDIIAVGPRQVEEQVLGGMPGAQVLLDLINDVWVSYIIVRKGHGYKERSNGSVTTHVLQISHT